MAEKKDMSEAAKKAWETRRKLYGEKGFKPKEEEKVEEKPEEKPSKKEDRKKAKGKASKSERTAESQGS